MKASYMDINGRQSVKIEVGSRCAVHEAEEIRQEVKTVYNKGIYHILFDLSGCTFMDSTGLGLLVSVHKVCAENAGKMILYRPSEDVKKLMNMTRLDQVFDFA